LLLPGCVAPSYYLQAAAGQIQLWRLSRPLTDVQSDPQTSDNTRHRLTLVRHIRDFATRELHLPDNGSYRKYADLNRPYVVWNVFAASEFSVTPRQWCFPVAGCVSYRGYFARADADAYAELLRGQGYEVHVGGVPAYSTLGWFDDPILNTFIFYPETELARLIFHELSHQVVYVGDDSEFNESFATAVELAGVRRWLARHGDLVKREAFEQAQQRRRDFIALVLKYRTALDENYRSGATSEEIRRRKRQLLTELKQEYAALKRERWSGYAGYDRWFGQDLNNAMLASVGIYTRLEPTFQALLDTNKGDLPSFYRDVRSLAALPKENRLLALERAAAVVTGEIESD